jgi:Holliday junction resolvase-like predicted endonuclease
MAETVVERPIPTGEGLTFEKVWAMFQEDREQMREQRKEAEERRKEAERQAEERRKEADRQWEEIREQRKETEKMYQEMVKQRKINDKKMGDLQSRFGQMAEHLVAPGIEMRFKKLGYRFVEINEGVHKLFGDDGKILAEIDILLENGETLIAVEVKTRPDEEDIKRHIERLEIIRDFRLKKKNERKKVLGAMAGAIFPKHIKDAAHKAGLFVIVQSGDTMKIEMPEGWKPREW